MSAMFSEYEVDATRTLLAKKWRQSRSQVTDDEARDYLRSQLAVRLKRQNTPSPDVEPK